MPNNPHELPEEVKVKLDDLEAESQAWQADKSDTKTLLEVRKDADMAILKALTTAHQQGVEAERKRIVENLFPDKKGDYKAWYDGDKLCVVNLNALTERETE